MSILDKFGGLKQSYGTLQALGADPFAVSFDSVLSPVEATIGQRRVLVFGSNNYLGLTFNPQIVEDGVTALRAFGSGTTGSRIANGTYQGHAALERRLAKFLGRRHAMIFTTGYQANLAMMSTLVGKDDHLLIDADSHASIYDGCRLGASQVIRFRHNDADDLARRLRRLEGSPGHRLIVVEGIYSMLGDRGAIAEIAAVKRETGAYLLVDEAHSLGVLGRHGRGAAEEAGVEGDVDFVVGTFSKSLGAIGGFCVSDIDDFDILRVTSRPYMFTASLPPAVVATTLSALSVIEAQPALRERLLANASQLYHGLAKAGFQLGPQVSPIVSVKLPDIPAAAAFWGALLEAGIYVNLALPPATPTAEPLLRTSVTAAHTEAQIDQAVTAITAVGAKLGVI
jgi:7-keto-8-aminopelargonate synthetase and related enzymes